jgi:ABC-type sugar transport system permease subunit
MESRVSLQSSVKRKNKIGFLHEMKKNYLLYLLALPGMLVIFVFSYLPMGGIVIAFQNYNPIKDLEYMSKQKKGANKSEREIKGNYHVGRICIARQCTGCML